MDSVAHTVAVVLNTDDGTALGLLIATFVILFTILLLLFIQKRAVKGNSVLIVGLSDAGKTAIFTKFVAGTTAKTYTSMKENIFSGVQFGKHLLSLIDVPGSDKVRKRIIDAQFVRLGKALKAVLCVVDAASFSKSSRDVAEFIYDTLLVCPANIPMLIACNKQDLPVVKSEQAIRSSLEKEFTLLNKSRSASLGFTDDKGVKNRMLTKSPEFSWKELGRKVEFCECSAIESENSNFDLIPVQEWIENL